MPTNFSKLIRPAFKAIRAYSNSCSKVIPLSSSIVARVFKMAGSFSPRVSRRKRKRYAIRMARSSNPRVYIVHLYLAAALGLNGDLDARVALAEGIKLKPELDSLAAMFMAIARGAPCATCSI